MKHRLALRRRALLAAALLAAPRIARAQDGRLGILGHAMHRAAVTTGPGGDVLAEVTGGLRVEWRVLGTPAIHDRLAREASLRSGTVDLAFVLDRHLTPRLAPLLLPLDGPEGILEGLAPEDIPAGLRAPFTIGGRLHGLPFCQATSGFFWNEALVPGPGLPPDSPEALFAAVRAGRADAIDGLVLDGPGARAVIDLARMWDGGFITPDLQLRVEDPAMVGALEALAALFREGVLPRSFPRFSAEQATAAMQQGRAAFAIAPFGRHAALNDPAASRHPGKVRVAAIPASAGIANRFPVAPVGAEVWSLVIPRNAGNRDAAIRVLRHIGGAGASLRIALNGNGPARLSTARDPRYAARVPWAAAEAAAMAVARPALPAFGNMARAEQIFREEVEAMLVRDIPAAEAAAGIARRVRPLLG